MKRILFIGLGGIGQRHLRNVKKLVGSDVKCYALRRKESSQFEINNSLELDTSVDIEDAYSISTLYDIDSAMAVMPDVTFICTPSSMHIEYAEAALNVGSHVFIEKPLSNSIEKIDDLEELSKATNKVIYVGFQLRFNPVLKKLRELVVARAVGRILAVRAEVAEYMPGFHKYENYKDSYASRAELGGGVVLTQIHELDYLQWIFGFPKSLYAVGGSISRLELSVEDVVGVLMEMVIDSCIVPVTLHMDFLQQPTRRSCFVYGEKGSICADLASRQLILVYPDGSKQEYSWAESDRNQQFVDQTRHFFDCVTGSATPNVGVNEGKKSLLMALAVKHSFATRESVDLQ